VKRDLASLRDRPVSADERRTAVLAVLAVLISAVALLDVTHDPSPRRAQPHGAASAAPPAPPPPATASEALSVAHTFLSGYLAYAYRGAPAGNVSDATHALMASLADHPPRMTSLHEGVPRVIELHLSGPFAVTAVLNDGGIVNYTLGLALTRPDGRLVVARLESE
jgi:hypothetical protein